MDMQRYNVPVSQKVFDHIDSITVEQVIEKITPRGNGKKIKSNKPKQGIFAYIWRQCTFHSGIDPTMPCTDVFDLSDGIKEATGEDIGFSILDETRKLLLDKLEKLADGAMDRIPGINKYKTALSYKGLLY